MACTKIGNVLCSGGWSEARRRRRPFDRHGGWQKTCLLCLSAIRLKEPTSQFSACTTGPVCVNERPRSGRTRARLWRGSRRHLLRQVRRPLLLLTASSQPTGSPGRLARTAEGPSEEETLLAVLPVPSHRAACRSEACSGGPPRYLGAAAAARCSPPRRCHSCPVAEPRRPSSHSLGNLVEPSAGHQACQSAAGSVHSATAAAPAAAGADQLKQQQHCAGLTATLPTVAPGNH